MQHPIETIEPAQSVQISGEDLSRIGRLLGRRLESHRRLCNVVVLIISEILLAALVWEVVVVVHRFWSAGAGIGEIALVELLPGLVLWVSIRALLGLYPGYGLDEAEELRRQTYTSLIALAAAGVVAYVSDSRGLPLILVGFAGLMLLAPVMRYLVKLVMHRTGLWGKPVIVLGSRGAGLSLWEMLHEEWQLGFRPVIVSDSHSVPAGEAFEAAQQEGPLADALLQAQARGVDTVVFAMPYTRRQDLAKLVGMISERFRYVIIMPNLSGIANTAVTARCLAGNLGVEIRHTLLDPWARRAKLALDLIATVTGGLLISPLLLAVVVMVKLDAPGPAFYGHRRLGAGGRHFRCWKFRTMYTNADQVLEKFLRENPESRIEWEHNFKLRDDPRVTRVGRFLRKTSLDELPQLWNVLRGEMSLVGPRPIVEAEIPKYGTVYGMYQRTKPGISGLWQASGRSDTSYDERVRLDAYYVHNWSVWLDIVILVRTVRSVLFSQGAY